MGARQVKSHTVTDSSIVSDFIEYDFSTSLMKLQQRLFYVFIVALDMAQCIY